MSIKYRALAILTVCVFLFIFVLGSLQPTAVYSGDATPESFNFLPLMIAADGTPTPTPIPSPTPAPTVIPPGAVPNVTIDQIIYDPITGNDLDGENVRILNNEAGPVNLTGWRLSDEASTVFVFPEFVLESGSSVRVWVKEGVDGPANLYWGRGRSVWNNAGDTAELKNSDNILVDLCSYPGGSNSAECN